MVFVGKVRQHPSAPKGIMGKFGALRVSSWHTGRKLVSPAVGVHFSWQAMVVGGCEVTGTQI